IRRAPSRRPPGYPLTVPPPRPAMRSNAPVRPGQLPERLAISGPCPESRSAVTVLRAFLPQHVTLPPIATPPRRGALGGSQAPSFPAPRCKHYRPPERSEHRIVLGATGGTGVMTEIITPPGAPVAAGPYSPGLLTGDWIFLSGQGGFDPETGELVNDN